MSLPQGETGVDTWIAERLGTDVPDGSPAWRARLTGTANLSRAVASINPVRYVQIKMTSEFARTLWEVAQERGMSRESFIRVVLAKAVAEARGLDPDDLLTGMPPRRKGR